MTTWCDCAHEMVDPCMCNGCEYDRESDFCTHEEYDSDILTGRATCASCGHTWWQSAEEIEAEIERIRRYDEWEAEQRRPWNRFREWLREHMPRRPRRRPEVDDGIPF